MIRNDEIDRTVQQSFPKFLPIVIVPDRWTAFEQSLTFLDLFRVQTQVMETGFDRDWKFRNSSSFVKSWEC